MAGKIFINYRREDSIAIAGRLHDRLSETFGRDNLFIDVANIPVGINFEQYLKSQVAACDVFLSIIGPNWLNAKDETDQRRLDKPDDFVAIEIAAALARDILVIPVLVDSTHMPKASELPASLKPFALRNAIQVRNTNFGSDAEQLITKMREALAFEGLKRTQAPVLLLLNAHLAATFLFNIGVFLFALAMVLMVSNNFVGSLAAMVASMLISIVSKRTLARDESVRTFGIVVSVGGLLAVAAFNVSAQFFRVDLFEGDIQNWSLSLGIYFLVSALFFGWEWTKLTAVTETPNNAWMRLLNSRWFVGFAFLSTMVFMPTTWMILYRLTDSLAVALALGGVQLLVVGYCYALYRKALGANPAQAPS